MIEIWEPRWHDRTVLIAVHKVSSGLNEIKFTKTPSLEGKIYTLPSETIRKYPIESNGKINCYAVPLGEFKETEQGVRL